MNKQKTLRKLAALVLGICCLVSIAAAEMTISQPPVYVNLTWDPEYDVNGLAIRAYVSGTLDDGSDVIPMDNEGEYLSSTDYSHVGSHYIYGNGLTELTFYRLDGDYSIIVEWGNDELLFSGLNYADLNLNIEIATDAGTLINIAADAQRAADEGRENLIPVDNFYYRGGTGVWYFGFRIDHGTIAPLYGDEAAQAPAAEPQPDVQYVQDSQMVETYNENGCKITSEWHEGGVITAYTYWDYDKNGNLVQIRYANAMDPDEVVILFSYENGAVQMYNLAGTLLAEAESAYAAAEQLGMGYIVAESMGYAS